MSLPNSFEAFGEALWNARATGRAIPAPPGPRMSRDDGERVAWSLYAREAGPIVAWKVGATDDAAQTGLSTDRPFAAPLRASSVLADDAVVARSAFCAPKLEAEIGLQLRPGAAPLAMPCLELVDSRIQDWDVSIGELLADFGAHGRVVFGEARETEDVVNVSLEHDGVEVASGSRSIAEAVALSEVAVAAAAAHDAPPPTLVASGTLIAPVPLRPGRWTARYGWLGTVSFTFTD